MLYVSQCAKQCRCYRDICDGVLSGGLCDDIQPTWDEDDVNDDWRHWQPCIPTPSAP